MREPQKKMEWKNIGKSIGTWNRDAVNKMRDTGFTAKEFGALMKNLVVFSNKKDKDGYIKSLEDEQ